MCWLSRCLQATLFSIFGVGILSWVLVESGKERIVEKALAPVFWMSRKVTPSEWQFQGNILLGLAWLAIGVIIYGLVVAMICVTIFDLHRRRQGKDS